MMVGMEVVMVAVMDPHHMPSKQVVVEDVVLAEVGPVDLPLIEGM